MNREYLPLCRNENIVIQNLANETLLYDLEADKAFCLNQTSALVWNACNGRKTVAEISCELTEELKSPVTEELVSLALTDLNKEGLLVHSKEFANKFSGVSRRKMIKKVGLTTVVALPVISTLIAPVSADAQSSCIASGGACPVNLGQVDYPYAPCCNGTCLYVGTTTPGLCN